MDSERTVACELLPTRYDQVAAALGGHGEFVPEPDQLESGAANEPSIRASPPV